MKNYKLLMLTAIFAFASSLDAMPPKGKSREPSVPSATPANQESAPVPASADTLSNFALYCTYKEELEQQVDQLVIAVGVQEDRYQSTTGRLQSELSALTETHSRSMREKEEQIEQINQEMKSLRDNSAHSVGEKDAQIEALMDQKTTLERALADLEPKHSELVRCLERVQVTAEQKQTHDERKRRVAELLARVNAPRSNEGL